MLRHIGSDNTELTRMVTDFYKSDFRCRFLFTILRALVVCSIMLSIITGSARDHSLINKQVTCVMFSCGGSQQVCVFSISKERNICHSDRTRGLSE